MTSFDQENELYEFLEQVNYALSLEFKDKWRHRFSENFITLFQDKVLTAFQTQKPVKISSLISFYVKKHKYSYEVVQDFFRCIDITLYSPLIYKERKTLKP
jgi:hypothetical protein